MNGQSARVRVIAALFAFAFSSATFAQTSAVTDRVTLAGTDYIDWEALDTEGDGVQFLAANPDTISSNNGVAVTVSTLQGNLPVVLVDGGGFWLSNFLDADYLLSTNANNNNANDVVFSNFDGAGVCGLGTQVTTRQQLDTEDAEALSPDYSVRITALDNAMALLGSHVINGEFDLEAPFVGIESTQAMHYVVFTIETLEVPDPLTAWFGVNQVDFRFCEEEPPGEDGLTKTLLEGNDFDTDALPDLVVEIGLPDPATYSFALTYVGDAAVSIEDVVPAQWDVVTGATNELGCAAVSANGRDDGKSSTRIACEAAGTGTTVFEAIARCHHKNGKCKPASCGAVILNTGAAAYLPGETEPHFVSNALCLAAVEDLDGGGLDYTGAGDEDGDGLADWAEACELGFDPCNADTDGDGINDDVDACPLDPLDEC